MIFIFIHNQRFGSFFFRILKSKAGKSWQEKITNPRFGSKTLYKMPIYKNLSEDLGSILILAWKYVGKRDVPLHLIFIVCLLRRAVVVPGQLEHTVAVTFTYIFIRFYSILFSSYSTPSVKFI